MEVGLDGDALTRTIIDAIITVHRVLGPGFVEAVYQRALALELRKRDLSFATEVQVQTRYDGVLVGGHRLDFVVDGRVLIELKTVEALGKVHYAQVRSYLRSTGLPVALLVNFSRERADYRRVDIQ